ncbi:MAG: hypothetical protein ACRDMX_04085 [Solirubrobacteraceae bacterium]
MRVVILLTAVTFTALIAVLTALDIVHNGVNWLDVVALCVVVLFGTGLIGSLLARPPDRGP